MGKHATKIQIRKEDEAILERWAKSRSVSASQHDRAVMIIECSLGTPINEIARKLDTYPNKVIEWRERYKREGIAGLQDKPRLGRPKVYPDLKKRLLDKISQPVPKGYSRWDAALLSKELSASDDAIWRILKKEGILLHRQRSWCISTDKDFAPKAADIVGLYLDPPMKAIVLCVDEKPSIQALERKTGYIETRDGKIVRAYKSTYKRHGTLNLFAALHVATGRISTSVTEYKTRQDFLGFMDGIVAEYPDEDIHVILDNYCTHKKNEEWLTAHPLVHFHFTPTSASWLNMVEIWFGIFSRKSLTGASFASKEAFKEQIEAYSKVYNENSRPFVWRKREVKGSQLKNNIVNLRN
ncbi:MAG: IS630 family transposase [Anditalea sp.]